MQKNDQTRRDFLRFAGISLAGGIAGAAALNPQTASASELTILEETGTDMAGWQVVVGDGLWVGPNQDPVNQDDILTNNFSSHSELIANTWQRGVMAHNITYKTKLDDADRQMFRHVHLLKYKFRMPEVPTTAGSGINAQTLEGGFFIWDGSNTRLDYGLAFQWILNPWMSTFGDIRTWHNEEWVSSGYLQPDTEWHEIEFAMDYYNQLTAITIDGISMPCTFSATTKDASWGNETAARLQAEIISIWPGANPSAPHHKAEFKDWQWTMVPYGYVPTDHC